MADWLKSFVRRAINATGYDVVRRVRVDQELEQLRRLHGEESVRERRFYNVGAGGFRHPAWTNVDHANAWYGGVPAGAIEWDLLALTPLPVEDASAEIIYTSHTVEHVTDAACRNLFREAHRALKPGGFLRITTPDIDLYHHAYRTNDRSFFYWIEAYSRPEEVSRCCLSEPMRDASIQQIFLYEFASSVSLLHADGAPTRLGDEELDRIFREKELTAALDHCTALCPIEVQKKYAGNHINWWSREKALRMLREAGFSRTYVSGYGQSRSPSLRNTHLFDSTHPRISLYVEAIK